MGERKVLNKYYPPDFDTIRLPKLPGGRPDQYVIRIMAPFTMRCLTCGNYVYKGRKFNSRKEDAQGEKYLGIQIYRFYIRCPECLSEITFKTDPQNADYVPEHGAIRTFQAERLAELDEQREVEEKEEEEANNPMLALENRTAESRMEMDVLDALEEIRDWNSRNASVKHEHLLEGIIAAEKKEVEEEEAALTAMASKIFEEKRSTLRKLEDDETGETPPTKRVRVEQPQASGKSRLLGLVVRKNKNVEKTKEIYEGKSVAATSREESGVSDNEQGKDLGTEGPQRLENQGGEGSNIGGEKGQERSTAATGGGLGMLCGYSDSSDSD